jgi:hypothetical protein
MVTPLDLVHLDLPSTGETDIFFQNMDGSLVVSRVMVEVNGILVDFLEGLGLVRGLETLTKLGDVEDVVKLGQLWRQV